MRNVEMRVSRGRDLGGIHRFRELRKGSDGRDPKLAGNLMCSRLIRVVDRRELRAGKFRIKARMIFPNVPDADHTNATLVHCGCADSRGTFCKNHS